MVPQTAVLDAETLIPVRIETQVGDSSSTLEIRDFEVSDTSDRTAYRLTAAVPGTDELSSLPEGMDVNELEEAGVDPDRLEALANGEPVDHGTRTSDRSYVLGVTDSGARTETLLVRPSGTDEASQEEITYQVLTDSFRRVSVVTWPTDYVVDPFAHLIEWGPVSVSAFRPSTGAGAEATFEVVSGVLTETHAWGVVDGKAVGIVGDMSVDQLHGYLNRLS